VTSTESDLTQRRATNADCEAIQALVFGVLAEFGLAPDFNGTDRDITDIETHYLDRGGVFEVIENDEGTIVGTVGLYPLDERTVELRKMYFAPDIRGRGLGKKLLQEMIEKARNLGYLSIYLETASVLKQAVHLYEKAGFTPVIDKHTPRCDQAFVLELDK
jgi:putative acetyltransferase